MTDNSAYGKALFLAAAESGVIDEVYRQLAAVDTVIREQPDYVKLLDTPALSRQQKHELIDRAFGGFELLVTNLIKMLGDRGVFFAFEKVVKAYGIMYDEYYNIERAEAVTARPLTEAQSRALVQKLEEMTGKRVVLSNTIDPYILGGIAVRYSGKQLDGSLRRRLDELEAGLKNTVI